MSQDTPETRKPHRHDSKVPSRAQEQDMGTALRSVYQKTVEETIPDEMLDLLGKLD